MKLDADFAAVVDTGKLHVFLTPHDEHLLHVAARSAGGFAVNATPSSAAAAAGKKAGDLSGTFSYRVVAKRKDVKAERLAKYTMPTINAGMPPTLPEVKLPTPPTLTVPPAPPQAPPSTRTPPVSVALNTVIADASAQGGTSSTTTPNATTATGTTVAPANAPKR